MDNRHTTPLEQQGSPTMNNTTETNQDQPADSNYPPIKQPGNGRYNNNHKPHTHYRPYNWQRDGK